MPMSAAGLSALPPVAAASSGAYLMGQGSYGTSIDATAYVGKIVLGRIVVPYAMVLSAICLNFSTAAAGKSVRLGLYRDSAGYPGALVIDAGVAALDTAALKEIAASAVLPAGVYWGAMISDAATGGTINAHAGSGGNYGVPNTTAGAHNVGYTGVRAFGAMPANLPALTSYNRAPGFMLRAA